MTSTSPPLAHEAWAREEVEAAVADYLAMLTLELGGQAYSKTEHRRNLARKLSGRSDSAIERKHQNISAILHELGYPPIAGYKPLGNFQRLLFEVVAERLKEISTLDAIASAAVERPAVVPTFPEFSHLLVRAPQRAERPTTPREDPADVASPLELRALKRDYLEREARNRSLGDAGERLVVELERWRLEQAGQTRLAGKVQHVSKEMGDGLGFDVLSYFPNGAERYIEVKTTSFGRDTPFFVTQREVEVSVRAFDKYALYRVFEFRRQPRLYELEGKIADHCWLHPQTFRATFT
jgi:hypothetical protein